MTITADHTLSPNEQLEEWRDDMVTLAFNAYYGDHYDTHSLAIVANALEDVRVRDVLIWYVSGVRTEQLHDARAVLRTMWEDGNQTAPVATFIAIIQIFLNDTDEAMAWAGRALVKNSTYSLAHLCWVSLINKLPASELKPMFNAMDYETVRYGS